MVVSSSHPEDTDDDSDDDSSKFMKPGMLVTHKYIVLHFLYRYYI